MAITPKTGLRTPADGTDPFTAVFDSEFAADIDDWIDANSADGKLQIHADRWDAIPHWDQASGTVIWGKFQVYSPRYSGVLKIGAGGSAAMVSGDCLYIDAPARPFAGQTVVATVGTLPQTGRDRIVLGYLTSASFHLIGTPGINLLGYGPAPGIVRVVTVPENIYEGDTGKLIHVDQGVTLSMAPNPDSNLQTYFIKVNGTASQYVTLGGAIGALGWLGPHERVYGAFVGSLRLYGGGGIYKITAHEPVPGSGQFGWLIEGTGKYADDSNPLHEWHLDGGPTENAMVTPDGGFAVRMIAHVNLVAGEVVTSLQGGGVDGKVDKCPIAGNENDMPYGIVWENASADDPVWIVVAGKVRMLPEAAVTVSRGFVAGASTTTAGRVVQSASVGTLPSHWRECGHFVEDGAGAGVAAMAIVHFN